MNRATVVKVIVIIAIAAAAMVAINMMRGKSATLPKMNGGNGD